MNKRSRPEVRAALLLTIALLTACAAELPAIVGCEANGQMQPICDMKSPEDIAALDDQRHLLLAHYGGMEGGRGSLSVFDTRASELTPVYPGGSGSNGTADWGDAACTEPPNENIGPHGTHLHQLADGRWRYLVVNHNQREAVEIFELKHTSTPAAGGYSLTWRGCIFPTEDSLMNDTVGLANGDIIYSRMFRKSDKLAMLKSAVGIATGEIWRWSATTGLRALPGSEAAQPNGLEISADNRHVFANMYMEEQVWKIDADSGEVVGKAEIAFADNSAWGTNGELWVTRHDGGLGQMMACFESLPATCAASFEIVSLNPETLSAKAIFNHSGAPMGAATVAVPMAGRVYMGSFTGDRMISVPLSAFRL